MSSQGGGKAKAKRSRQEKPYERRQTDGSLLGRLTSTVSSLLPGGWVPSWLLNPPPTSSVSTPLAGSTSGPSTSSSLPPPATQRNQLNSHMAHQSSSQSRRHNQSNHRYPPHQPASSHVLGRIGGPSGGSADSVSGTTPSVIQPLSQDSAEQLSLALADSMAQRRRQRHQLQEDDHQLQLSNTDRESPTEQLQPPIPSSTASAAKRARFQPAALNTSLQLDTSVRSMDGSGALSRTFCGASSSYYPGPTVYGGAANHRRLRVIPATSAAPYQARRPRAVGSSVSSATGDPASSTSNLSSSSRRILAALERMSTPVWDAQRQPHSELPPAAASVAASTSLLDAKFSGERRRGLYGALGARLGAQRRGVVPGPTDTPPVQRQNTPRAVQLQENRATRLAEEAAAASQRATDALQDMQQRRDQPANRLVKHVTFSSDTPSTAALAGGGGGKMRRAKELRHYRSSESSDVGQHESALPDVSLSTPAPLRPLHFLHTSTPKSRENQSDVDIASQPFEFSAPRASCISPSNAMAAFHQPAQFSFSRPRPARPLQHRVSTGASPALSDNQLSRLPSGGSAIDDAVITNSHTNSGWGDKFRPTAGEWTCSVCMVRNQQSISKCVACQAPSGADDSSQGAATANSSPWGNKFLPVAGEWTCSACMVKNQSSSSKCVACETPCGENSSKGTVTANSSSWGGKFLPVAGEWTCSTCMVKNQASSSKCVACETPGGDKNSSQGTVTANSSSWGNKFLPVAGEWTCSMCMVKNTSSSSKCVACETPGGEFAASALTQIESQRTSAADWECLTCLVRNRPAVSRCIACQSLRADRLAKSSTADSAVCTPKFQFGVGSDSAAAKFSFGFSVPTSSSPSGWASSTAADPTGAGGYSEVSACEPVSVNGPSAAAVTALKSASTKSDKPNQSDESKTVVANRSDVKADGQPLQFLFGSSAAAKSSASSTTSDSFVFGIPTAAKSSAASTTSESFVFGIPAAAKSSAASTTSESFAFGIPAAAKSSAVSTTSESFAFGIPAAAKSSAASITSDSFAFGIPAAAKSSTVATTFESFSKFVSSAAVSSTPVSPVTVSSTPVSSVAVSSTPVSSVTVSSTPVSSAAFVFGSGVSSAAAALVFGCPTPVSSAAVSAAPELGSSASSVPVSSASTSAVATAVTSPSLFSAPASSVPVAGFSFGATAAPAVTTASAAAVSSSPFSFGAVSSSAAATTTSSSSAGLFSFGSSTDAAPATKSTAAAVFAFGNSAAPASVPVSSAVPSFSAFGANANSTAVSNHVPSSSGFAFGTNSSQQSVPAAGAFSFGAPASSVAVPGAFSFGSKPSSDSAAAKPQSAVFAFGAKPAEPKSSTVTFGAASGAPAVFGANRAGANVPAIIGAKPVGATVPAVFGATTAASVAQSSGVFSFGAATAPSSNSDGFAFGAKSAAPSGGVFAFGAKPAAPQPTAAAPSMFDTVPSGFQFGGAAAAPTPFGQTAPVAGGAFFGSAAAPPAAAAGVFSFGGAPAATPTAALPATGAPGIFQFGAQPAGSAAGPFGATQPNSGNPFDVTGAGGTRKIKTARRRIRK